MPERVLYQVNSPACRMVRWLLRRKGLAFEAREATQGDAQWRERSEGAEPPILVEGEREEGTERVLAGATAIAFYLERRHPSPSLFPADPQQRNQAVTLAEFAENAIGALAAELACATESARRAGLVAELRQRLGQVREVIGRRALDSGAAHLGDIAVAAELVACAEVPELDFGRDYGDLADYAGRVAALCGSSRDR